MNVIFRGGNFLAECRRRLLSETQLNKWRTYGITLQKLGGKKGLLEIFFSVGTLETYFMSVSEWNFIALTSYTVTPTLYSSRVSLHRKWISGNTKRNGAVVGTVIQRWTETRKFSEPYSVITNYCKETMIYIFHFLKYTLYTQFFEAYMCFYRNVNVDTIIKPIVSLHNITCNCRWQNMRWSTRDSGHVCRGGLVLNKGGIWGLLLVGATGSSTTTQTEYIKRLE